MGAIEITNKFSEGTTVGVDLSSNIPMTLCQNVVLAAGNKYTLSFDLYASVRIQNLTGRAFLNNALLTSVYIPTNLTFKTQVFTFYASQDLNTLCFNETHSGAPPFPYMPNVGGVIDNFSLYIV